MYTTLNATTAAQRSALIEKIAVVTALALTANSDSEYVKWDSRRDDLVNQAGALTPDELTTIQSIAIARQDAYNQEAAQ